MPPSGGESAKSSRQTAVASATRRCVRAAIGCRARWRDWAEVRGTVGTLAWNTQHHLEIYYAAMGAGYVCHTLNPRLTVAHLSAMVNEARGSGAGGGRGARRSSLRSWSGTARASRPWCCWTAQAGFRAVDWRAPDLRYREPARASSARKRIGASSRRGALGTVLHLGDHRATTRGALYPPVQLPAYVARSAGRRLGIDARRTPCWSRCQCFMRTPGDFRSRRRRSAPSWCCPGATLTGRGSRRSSAKRSVTVAAGVQTVWQGLLDYLEAEGGEVPSLERVVIGGRAVRMRSSSGWNPVCGHACRPAGG